MPLEVRRRKMEAAVLAQYGDSLSEEEKEQLELERRNQEKSVEIKKEDYQLADALDILTSLSIYQNEKFN